MWASNRQHGGSRWWPFSKVILCTWGKYCEYEKTQVKKLAFVALSQFHSSARKKLLWGHFVLLPIQSCWTVNVVCLSAWRIQFYVSILQQCLNTFLVDISLNKSQLSNQCEVYLLETRASGRVKEVYFFFFNLTGNYGGVSGRRTSICPFI